MSFENPYPDDGQKHFVTARVAAEDYFYLKAMFPMTTGLTDKIISTLYKKFTDELRQHEATNGKLEIAWYVDSPTHNTVGCILAEFQRCTTGQSAGYPSPRPESGTAGGLRETLQRPEEQRPDTKGSVKSGRPRKVNRKKKNDG